jgi:hypothetical protein
VSISPSLPELPEQSAETAIEQVQPLPDLYSLLPIPHMNLTASEKEAVDRYQLARSILGPVAASPMTCPNPESEPTDLSLQGLYKRLLRCPHARSCVLRKAGKAPYEQPCPLETSYVIDRYVRWTNNDFNQVHPNNLSETDRVTISELVAIDLGEQRCLDILGEAEHARLSDISIKETASNGDPIAWEKVLHINQQVLEGLSARRTRILKSFELTPEMKTKKKKYEGGEKGADLSSIQSSRAERLKRGLVIEG